MQQIAGDSADHISLHPLRQGPDHAALSLDGPGPFYILDHMKQVLVEFDDETLARLERVIPSRSRRRSQFIRSAVNRALWELEEQATAEAYRRLPDASDEAYQDAAVWEPGRTTGRAKRRRP